MSENDPSAEALALMGGPRRVLGDWTVAGLTGLLAGGVSVWLERPRDGATLQVVVTARGRKALVETPLGGVLYHRHSGLTEREAGDTTRAFAALLSRGEFPLGAHFPHLVLGADDAATRARLLAVAGPQMRSLPGPAGADDGRLPSPRGALYFDPPGLAEFLAPELVADGAALAGYTLRAIYLPAVGKRAALDFASYVLEFVDEATAESVRLRLTAGGGAEESFGRAGELSLGLLGYTQELDALPPRVASLCSWVLALLHLKSDAGLRVEVPADAAGVRALSHPAGRGGWVPPAEAPGSTPEPPGPPPALNLAIDTECGQRCAFCSVKAYVRPVDEGDLALERIRLQLRMARDQGVREVRLNGIDPLTFSRVLEVLDNIQEYGFSRLSVYSPCRRLAEGSFRREFLRRMPPEFTVSVPLYGVTAAAHEAVTGAPGSFVEVMAALEGLLAETPPGHVVLSTVVVRQNLHEFLDVVAFARARGLGVHPHLPYPMRQTARDPYADAALRERDLVEHFVSRLAVTPSVDPGWSLGVLGSAVPHPCLLWRAEQKHRLPVFGARTIAERQPLAGTEYRSRKIVHDTQGARSQENAFAVATVPCPHLDRCALAPVCPGEHYGVYEALYGLDEFSPVRVAELYAASPSRGPRP